MTASDPEHGGLQWNEASFDAEAIHASAASFEVI